MLRKRGRRRDEAEDLVQEAFVRLLAYLDHGSRIVQPEAFIARAAINLSVDRSRRERAHLFEDRTIEELDLPAAAASPQEQVESLECVQQVKAILDARLGERARTVFFLHCFDGMTYDEIARRIRMSRRTVEKDLAKAITVLSMNRLPPP
jgi:RNA polymerase sigma-70 factor (ECF subfamily)